MGISVDYIYHTFNMVVSVLVTNQLCWTQVFGYQMKLDKLRDEHDIDKINFNNNDKVFTKAFCTQNGYIPVPEYLFSNQRPTSMCVKKQN